MEKSTKNNKADSAAPEVSPREEGKVEPSVKETRPREGGASSGSGNGEEGQPKVRVRDKRYWVQEEGGASETPESERKPSYVSQLEKRIEEGDKKLKEYINAYKLKMAETEEMRIRLEKSMGEQVDQRFARLVERLLPIIDHFALAVESTRKNRDFQSLHRGVEMIHRQLMDELLQTGVQPIQSEGLPFDPNLHEAVQVQPVKTREEDNMVVQELQTGYSYREKLLRPAKVVVGKFGGPS